MFFKFDSDDDDEDDAESTKQRKLAVRRRQKEANDPTDIRHGFIAIAIFAICFYPSKDTRPRRTEGTDVVGPQGRASASGHLSVST